MDKLNFVQDGATKLPPGFRFQPTDEEIVFQYLTRKTFSLPLPASVVPEITTICRFDPWDLPPGDEEQDRYLFTKKEAKYQNGNRTNRTTNSGYWKAAGSDKRITCPRRKDIMGMRKTLVFYRGKSPNGSRTDWTMHEYRLVESGNTISKSQNKNSTQNNLAQMGNWVLCRVFLRRTNTENNEENFQARTDERVNNVGVVRPIVYDFMTRDLGSSSSSASSCGSSVITEVTTRELDHEETSGYHNLSPYHYHGNP